MNIPRLQLFRAAARVERAHTVPPLHKQTDGEHTFNVLVLLDHVYPEASLHLWRAALYHDVPECVTGDIPSPMLHKYSKLREGAEWAEQEVITKHGLAVDLTNIELKVLKFCDRMELAIFCIEEADTGNIKMLRLYYRCMESIKKSGSVDVTPNALDLYDYVSTYVERYYGDQRARLNEMFHGTPNT